MYHHLKLALDSKIELIDEMEQLENNSQSSNNLKLLSVSTGTTISSSISIDQSYIDSNPGPYTVEGGSEENPIILSIVSDLIITSVDTCFIINSDFVIIRAEEEYVININDVSLYGGLVLNASSSNILISNITIKGSNSTLNPGAGWVAGKSFGVNTSNNLIEYCSNYLPISITSGGIVGRDSKVDISNCNNYGELLINPLVYDDGTNYSSNSGGIYGRDCEGNALSCNNYGASNGRFSSGIIGRTNKNFIIKNCANYADMSNYGGAGIVGAFFNDAEYTTLSISDCINTGNIKGKYGSGIITANFNTFNVVSITNCKNEGDVTGPYASGISTQLYNSTINSCSNYGNILSLNNSGILLYSLNTKVIDCKNSGSILGSLSAGIISVVISESFAIKCSNDGEVAGKDSGGILGPNASGDCINCTNSGSITGEGSGGICGPGCDPSNLMEYCVNNGEISGNNAGGIYGAWCGGTAKNCVNAGSVTGVSAGGIFGEFSNGVSDNCVNNGHLYGVNTRNI